MQQTKRIGERLLEAGLVDLTQLNLAMERQRQTGQPLGEALVSLGFVDEERLTAVLSEHLSTPMLDLKRVTVDPAIAALLPEDYARRHLVLPIRRENGSIVMALTDPADIGLLRDLELIVDQPVQAHLAARSDILRMLTQVHRVHDRLEQAVRSFEEQRPQLQGVEGMAGLDLASVTADSPAVEIVNLLIMQGLRDRSSDIHIEPQQDHLRIRFRVDGVLQNVAHLPIGIASAMASRIKVMADMNIVERHRSQDGQISLTVEGRDLDIRVGTLETVWGEKLVLRLLERTRAVISLQELGFSPAAHRMFSKQLQSPYGMIVVAGPTGSGKTTTLYAALNELDSDEKNLMTIEDPVEYRFRNINQTQINRAADLTFVNGLRAILRQDPDIILVGEVRDPETAEVAVQSALTGHLVMASLHATDSVSALLRLLEMGVEAYMISSSVIAIASQRLVRQICTGCAVAARPTPEEVDFAASLGRSVPATLQHGTGCGRCSMTGYYERIGVFEVLAMNETIKRLLIQRASHSEITAAAVAGGMVPLRADAWEKVLAGRTTVAEILRGVSLV